MLSVESNATYTGYTEINCRILCLDRIGHIRTQKETNLRVVDNSEREFRICYYFWCILLSLDAHLAR
jgi:hypothetical protein